MDRELDWLNQTNSHAVLILELLFIVTALYFASNQNLDMMIMIMLNVG